MVNHGDMINLPELAAQLVDNSYSPLYAIDKRCAVWKWPTITVTAADARRSQFVLDKNGSDRRWSKARGDYEHGWRCRPQAVALRLDNGLAVIDLDIDHPIIETVAKRVLEAVPQLYDAPCRLGGGMKEAWFCRAAPDADFFRMSNRRWCEPGSDPEAETVKTHQVEVYGGGGEAGRSGFKPKKYFGCFGAHTVDPSTGEVKRSYKWVEEFSPLTTPLAALPELSMADFHKVVDVAEATLAEHDWQALLRSGGGSMSGSLTVIYDLTEEMDIDGYKLSELYELAKTGAIGRGRREEISPVPWLRKSSASGASCALTVAHGAPAITDWQEHAMHLPAALKPPEKPDLAALWERYVEEWKAKQ